MERLWSTPWRITLALTVAAVLQGCSPGGPRELTWTETVTLAPGDTVEVERKIRFSAIRALSNYNSSMPDGIELYQSFLTIRRSDGPAATLALARLTPLLIDRDAASGDLLVVAGAVYCSYWYENGEPDPRYWGFRLHKGTWYRTDFRTEWLGRPANLLIDYRAEDDETIGAEDVAARKAMQRDNGWLDSWLRSIVSADPVWANCRPTKQASTEYDFATMGRM